MLSLALAFAPVAHAVAMVDAHVTESAKSLTADADASTPSLDHERHAQNMPKNAGDPSKPVATSICCPGATTCGLALDAPAEPWFEQVAADLHWPPTLNVPPDRNIIPLSPPPRVSI